MAKDTNNMRSLLGKMRDFNSGHLSEKAKIVEKGNGKCTMRDMLKKTRKLNEDFEQEQTQQNQEQEPVNAEPVKRTNKATSFDREKEERGFRNFFSNLMVSVNFIELEVFDDLITWGGTIDGMIQFMYSVTNDEATSGTDFNYLEGFSPDNADNDELIKRIESYYDIFYKYWRENGLATYN